MCKIHKICKIFRLWKYEKCKNAKQSLPNQPQQTISTKLNQYAVNAWVSSAMLWVEGFKHGKTNLAVSWTLRMMVIIQGRLLFAEWSMGEYGNIWQILKSRGMNSVALLVLLQPLVPNNFYSRQYSWKFICTKGSIQYQ